MTIINKVVIALRSIRDALYGVYGKRRMAGPGTTAKPRITKITVSKAIVTKCERCWRIVPLVCNLGICERCVIACQDDGWIEPSDVRGEFQLTSKWESK